MTTELAAELRAVVRAELQAVLNRAADRAARRFLPIPQAARYAGISAVSIRRLIKRGSLKAHRPVRGKIVIDRHELDNFVASAVADPRKGRGIRPAK